MQKSVADIVRPPGATQTRCESQPLRLGFAILLDCTTRFGGTIDFHNAVHFHPNRIDNDVVQPIKALNDVTYNDINEENGVRKQVFHPNSIGIQDKCRTFAIK